MIVTLTGANDHMRKRELAMLLAAFEAEHGNMAIERFDGEETGVDRMRESIQSLPFLSPRKLVILREPGKQKAFAEAIADVLSDVPESTDLIFYEPKLDKRGTYYKTLKKLTDFRELSELDAGALSKWAGEYTRGHGGSISAADARFLVERVGSSQQRLQNELDKLLAYDDAISRKTIELLTEPTPASTVFELMDAAFTGKAKRAFQLYRDQRALKVEPQAIIAMLAWQLHVLAVVKAADKLSSEQIAVATKLNSFVIRKSQGLVRTQSLAHIKQLIADLLELDTRLKRTSIDADEALQLYLLKLAS